MQTDTITNIINEEEIQKLFRTDIGHFADKSARYLFKRTEHLRGLVMFLAKNIAEHLDFSQAKIGNRSYIDDGLRDLMSDIVFTVPFRDTSRTDDLTIYILIEHQSSLDRRMGFRFLSYMCQIWSEQFEAYENAKVPTSQQRLRPILPIVFYTGVRKWNIPVSLNAVMDVPDLMLPFVPSFETLFFGVKDINTDEFGQQNHPFGWLMTVLQKVEADETSIDETLTEALANLDTLSPEATALHTHAIVYLSHLIVSKRPDTDREQLMQVIMKHNRNTEVENLIMTGAEALIQQGMKQGLEQGKAQGLEQGKAQGLEQGLQQGEIRTKREDLLKILEIRIGNIPKTITNKVSRLRSRARLDSLLEQAATAEKLDDIKWD